MQHRETQPTWVAGIICILGGLTLVARSISALVHLGKRSTQTHISYAETIDFVASFLLLTLCRYHCTSPVPRTLQRKGIREGVAASIDAIDGCWRWILPMDAGDGYCRWILSMDAVNGERVVASMICCLKGA